MPDSFFAMSTAGAWREVTRGSARPVEQAHVARQAFLDFNAAGLNFGDCFSQLRRPNQCCEWPAAFQWPKHAGVIEKAPKSRNGYLPHRARAALRAISLRCSAVNENIRAFPLASPAF